MKRKLVCGIGINDADYNVVISQKVDGKWRIVWLCPYYSKWCSMLNRCYTKKELEGNLTYKGCVVCDEWLLFSNFRKWMEQQEWEGRELDKDFLLEGNKVYSPSTCVFLPHKLNALITIRGNGRGKYPVGVCLHKRLKKNPYIASCSDDIGKKAYVGCFPTPEKAHQAWLVKKLEVCNQYLVEFKDEPLITKGLARIKNKLEYHIDTKTELKSF